MKRSTLIAAWTILLIAILHPSVQAQELAAPMATVSPDEKVFRALKERKGVVVVDAAFTRRHCDTLVITFGRKVDGQMRIARVQASSRSFGKTTFSGITDVPEGEYLLLSLTCNQFRNRSNFNGPHAKFQVRAGEIVNVGALKLQHESEGFLTRTGKTHRSIENISQEAMASLRERYPQSVAKMVKRPMTLVGPPDIRTQSRACGLLGCI